MLDSEQVEKVKFIKSRAKRTVLNGTCLFALFPRNQLIEFNFFHRGRVMIIADVSKDCESQFTVDLSAIDEVFLHRFLKISLDVRTCLLGYANENFVAFVKELLK